MLKEAEPLLLKHLALLTGLDSTLPVLDMACGTGRNGLVLAEQGKTVVFADRSATALAVVERQLEESNLPGHTWQVDLEQPGVNPLADRQFSAILVFRYLHRPLFPAMKDAVMPGGVIIYETFTAEQSRFGHPRNPDYLLRPGELKAVFQDWEIVHEFEGIAKNPERAVARIVARNPRRLPARGTS